MDSNEGHDAGSVISDTDAGGGGSGERDAGAGQGDAGDGDAGDGDAGDGDAGESGISDADAGVMTEDGDASDGGTTDGTVYVTLFTHIEDNTPPGPLGSMMNRLAYERLRASLIDVATRAQARGLPFVLQPDWKILEASLLYETGALLDASNGKNIYRYLREDLGVTVDPHSHENGGYNYTDIAYLLEQLGVGGSTVIGGHIWDPNLASFQAWDRFRTPQAGSRYPAHSWRGDILIGAGTPNHVNDPLASGVWRPLDRDHFFEDDPSGNIVAVGSWADEVAGVEELLALHDTGVVPAAAMLTAHWNIPPAAYDVMGGADAVDAEHFAPMATLVASGRVQVVDFQTLVSTWATQRGAVASLYMP